MEQKFEYTYSAKEKSELEKIRKKYTPKTSEESKLEQIKRLDKSVESSAMTKALIVGIIGSLILGVGMCCTMVWTDFFVLGIIVGIIGILVCTLAYPVYKRSLDQKRAVVGAQILKLSDEISGEL
ncbi:MAG: hypothetical protein IJC65_02140 [Oscillospiraceae bacterium]|nr:hypothetical protein [Oscillospiraceae bacterium]